MPRSRSPSPYRKTEKSRRLKRSSRRTSRSPSKSTKSKRYRSAERRSRRSRSTSVKVRRQSRSPSTKRSSKYSSNSSSRKSRSRRAPSRSSSSSTSSSSKSDSPAEERYIPLTKNKESKKSKVPPPSPPAGIFDSVNMLLDEPMMPETLDLINADEFVAKTFTSTKKAMDKVVIDLTDETISVAVVDDAMEVDSIFHPNLYADDSVRMEKYVKKLYNYRQKMFYGN